MAEPFATLSLEHSSTVDRVAAEVRRAVFEGELESGTPLREVALADSLGVSRQTVREALTALVTEGLLVREPHRGVAVATPDPDSIRDVCQVRQVLEGAGVRQWAEATDEQRQQVRTALADYRAAIRANASYQELNERHLAFHMSLVGLTGSPRLVHMAKSVVDELKLALAQVDRIRRNSHDQGDSHSRLVDLLDAGQQADAEAYLAQHLADAEVSILTALALD